MVPSDTPWPWVSTSNGVRFAYAVIRSVRVLPVGSGILGGTGVRSGVEAPPSCGAVVAHGAGPVCGVRASSFGVGG